MHSLDDVVALIPAAGFARRLGTLPCSKELLPAGWRAGDPAPAGKPLIAHSLDRLAEAGVRRALIIVRPEKADIQRVLGDGGLWGLDLDYLAIEPTPSAVHTLDAAIPHTGNRRVVLLYPDILFQPADAVTHVLEAQWESSAAVALGLFPSDQPEKSDMLELAPDGSVRRLLIKQPDRGLLYTWSIAVWSPAFSRYLQDFVRRSDREAGRELYVGDVIQSAIDDGFTIPTRGFARGRSIDMGTAEALAAPPDWATDKMPEADGR